ncbi:hypothetical protein HPB51_028415 [Rhipicephalus microplus]|uniref:Transposable element P transposase-like RNase H C-terminal domain-containing protein n=1 Tax=Rhipicephalus microplus TaxID=6941 RepID=A0A9J6CXB4_RHIMP|nr:hypothetical protein HPB51_028415 [Rhipicephalus microplus]
MAVFPTSMPTCYVPGCTSGYRNDANKSERHFFSALSDATLLLPANFSAPSEQGEPGFEDTEGTESFTRKMNDLLDALNAKCPAEGIRKNSPQIKVIIEFLDMLNSTEEESVNNNMKLFASQMTTESLQVTLMSVIDIITWLHNKDVRYVLTAKLNQDPLERFFGVVRSFRGNEGHPTITHFGQIFRLLSLYTQLKMATKGNCTGEADPVLVSVEPQRREVGGFVPKTRPSAEAGHGYWPD